MFRFLSEQAPDEEEIVKHVLTKIAEERPLFDIGGLATTPKIMDELKFEDIGLLLRLHDHGYWGTVPEMVALSNKQIAAGTRQGHIVSRYEWEANEIMIVSEKEETKAPLTKIYFVRDDIVLP
jgi:hypothetical protein